MCGTQEQNLSYPGLGVWGSQVLCGTTGGGVNIRVGVEFSVVPFESFFIEWYFPLLFLSSLSTNRLVIFEGIFFFFLSGPDSDRPL